MSLNLRIIISASLVLMIFITLTAAALNRAFIDSTESALRDQLTSQLYALLAAADVSDDGVIYMPSNELDSLLGLPSSGVYAYITDSAGKSLWQSSSVLGVVFGVNLPVSETLASGQKKFTKRLANINNQEHSLFSFAYGINWVTETRNIALTFNIATDLQSHENQLKEYRTTLWSWLLAMACLLLFSQAIILRWGLQPLRKVGAELSRIETGKQQQIKHSYPKEIAQLTDNINILLKQEREQKSRYRNALGDLAHSLKTPLAVLQSALNNSDENRVDTTDPDSIKSESLITEQIRRMNSIVEYQLQRAAMAGVSSSARQINLKSIIDRMLSSLNKVYRDKNIQLNISVNTDLTFKGDEGDLMELFGNLLDNAYKWANTRIDIIAERQQNKLHIRILDDGPGIKPEQVKQLLQRGERADQGVAGHGIGLSIVCNIVDAYEGQLSITKSALGGAQIQLIL